MPLDSEASGSPGNSQRSAGSNGSSERDRDDAMSDAPSQQDTATTTPAECTLPTIIMDYEKIDAYLTEIGGPDEITEALDRDRPSCTTRSGRCSTSSLIAHSEQGMQQM